MDQPIIRRLPDQLASQIAAGEVVERPASVVKELVENSLDAGAKRIEVTIEQGGKRLIQIKDDGCGMTPEQALLAFERHATSKIATSDDLFAINSFGFRGEALAAISSVAQIDLETRPHDAEEGVRISMAGGKDPQTTPAALPKGTRISIRNLFFNTPARLKFMRADRTETNHIQDLLQRLILANPGVQFRFMNNGRELLNVHPVTDEYSLKKRLSTVFGKDFLDNCLELSANHEPITVRGWLGLPTLNRANSGGQHFFVNGRPVKDKVLHNVARTAYRDLMARDRFPVLAVFVDLPPEDVDVNVHPAKTEIRFRHQGMVRGVLVNTLKEALTEMGCRTYQPEAPEASAHRPPYAPLEPDRVNLPERAARPVAYAASPGLSSGAPPSLPPMPPLIAGVPDGFSEGREEYQSDLPLTETAWTGEREITPERTPEETAVTAGPLGYALAQAHNAYIVAQTPEGVVLVDQHAAHERIVYEQLKCAFDEQTLERQLLLIPEVLELSPADADRVLGHLETLESLGVSVEAFGEHAFVIRGIPALLAGGQAKELVMDLVDDLEEFGGSEALETARNQVLTTMSCHGSVRSGRPMKLQEMNALLRQIEKTLFSGQCGHGRPTYVQLSLGEIEKLFGRR